MDARNNTPTRGRSPALSVAFSPDASFIAVGLSRGGVSVLRPSEEQVTLLILEKVILVFFSRMLRVKTLCTYFCEISDTRIAVDYYKSELQQMLDCPTVPHTRF